MLCFIYPRTKNTQLFKQSRVIVIAPRQIPNVNGTGEKTVRKGRFGGQYTHKG